MRSPRSWRSRPPRCWPAAGRCWRSASGQRRPRRNCWLRRVPAVTAGPAVTSPRTWPLSGGYCKRADADAVDAVIGSFLAELAGFASLSRTDEPALADVPGSGQARSGHDDKAEEGQAAQEPLAGALSVDGKAARGARQADGRAVHLLSAMIHRTRFVVAQRDVAHKTNEIPEVRKLLEPLDLRGWAVTLDAMHCQKQTARFLVEDKQAAYVFTAAKDNQPGLAAEAGRAALGNRAGQPRHDRTRPRPRRTPHHPGTAGARGDLAVRPAGLPHRTLRPRPAGKPDLGGRRARADRADRRPGQPGTAELAGP